MAAAQPQQATPPPGSLVADPGIQPTTGSVGFGATAPTLFVRMGDALIPLGCRLQNHWGGGTDCLRDERRKTVRVHPRLTTDADPILATPGQIEFPVSDSRERALIVGDSKSVSPGRPFIGFGTTGMETPVRITPNRALQFDQEAARWCDGGCRSVQKGSSIQLRARPVSSNEMTALALVVQASLDAAGFHEKLPSVAKTATTTMVSSEVQELFGVEVDTAKAKDAMAVERQLPAKIHFLLAKEGEGFRLLKVTRDHDFGLGEAGELLGAIDLDSDGTDELVIEWKYDGGRWLQLVRRDGEKLVMIGQFGDGA